jgi:hypothetical protein
MEVFLSIDSTDEHDVVQVKEFRIEFVVSYLDIRLSDALQLILHRADNQAYIGAYGTYLLYLLIKSIRNLKDSIIIMLCYRLLW